MRLTSGNFPLSASAYHDVVFVHHRHTVARPHAERVDHLLHISFAFPYILSHLAQNESTVSPASSFHQLSVSRCMPLRVKHFDNMSERDALSSRAIPFMELSDGSAASLTAPPPPLPHYLNAEGRAMARFAVEGNAVSKYYHRHQARSLQHQP